MTLALISLTMALLAFGAPLLGIWNVAPLTVGPSDMAL
jgi:hypothetical protein